MSAVQDLTEHPGWPVLVDWLNLNMVPTKRAILNGSVRSHEDYLKQAYWLKGVTDAIQAPQALAKLLADEQERRGRKA